MVGKRLIAGMTGLLLSASSALGQSLPAAQPVPKVRTSAPLTNAEPAMLPDLAQEPEQIAPPKTAGTPTVPPAKTPQPVGQEQPPTRKNPTPAQPPTNQPKKPDLSDRSHEGPAFKAWMGGEYWMAYTRNAPFAAPILNLNGTTVIGNESLDFGMLNAARVYGGLWLNERHTYGIETAFLLIQQGNITRDINSNGSPLLNRPFLNAFTNRSDTLTVASQGIAVGGMLFQTEQRVWGAEFHVVRNLYEDDTQTTDLLFGFRFLDLQEAIFLRQTSTLNVPTLVAGVPTSIGETLSLTDSFSTRNSFYGCSIGLRNELRFGSLFLGTSAKLAFGPNHQTLRIDGSTGAELLGTRIPGGFLAVPGRDNNPPGSVPSASNFGERTNDVFILVPEIGITLGVQLTRLLRVSVGYNFLYLNEAIRPGDQISTTINPAFVPVSSNFLVGQAPPAFTPVEPRSTFRQSEFWVHSLTFGLELRY